MEKNYLTNWLKENEKKFSKKDITYLKNKLNTLEQEKINKLTKEKLKDPYYITLMSIFFGWFGVDRFILGDFVLGIIKLLTFGILGIFWIIDIFIISKRTKDLNYKIVLKYI